MVTETLEKTLDPAAGGNDTRVYDAERAFFDIFFTNASEAIFITDPKGRLLAANPAYTAKLGLADISEVAGKVPAVMKSNHRDQNKSHYDDKNFFHTLLRTLKRKGSWKGETLYKRGDGTFCREWLSISSRKGNNGEITHYVGTIVNTADQMSQTLNRHYYDSLTRLPNRLLMQDRLEFMINHARRNRELMALLLIDIDRFKLVNETFGYEAGDALLVAIAERLTTCVRDVDVVFRSGDDEFAVILEEIAHEEDAAKVAKRILRACAGPVVAGGQEIHASVCMGISIFPNDGDSKVPIFQNAETAMHRARDMGVNNYRHYKPEMNKLAQELLKLENDLRGALEKGELNTFFQPQVEIGTQKIIGAEALIRWKHPGMGMIPPNRFIPMAEDTGLILPIGEWVLRSSCLEARKWHREGRRIVISVNLSANQFRHADLVPIVKSALADSGIQPELLELEITESMSMKNPEETLRMLCGLKELGVRIAIDDFGTGYSSLSYLKQFPIDTLKIDRSFLIDIPESPRDAEIVKAIIAMAQSLNLSVIAEGVEKETQSRYLLENGCAVMQGYLFSPPVPAMDFRKLLQTQNTQTTAPSILN